MGTITWIRPSGTQITTNDRMETITGCEEKGWLRADTVKKHEVEKTANQTDLVKPKKRGRPKLQD